LEELEARLVLSLPIPDHIVLLIDENQSFSNIIGNTSGAPYVNSLAQTGAVFTKSYAIEHPSQPNYLDLFSGSNQGIVDNRCPLGPFHALNLGGELTAAGLSFAGYHESMPNVGYTGCSSGYYNRNTNPLPDFSDVPSSDNKPFAGYFPTNFTTLPRIALVVPDLSDDMHYPESSITKGDTWIKNKLQAYINWTYQHNSLFILTFDEDDFTGDNQIPTIFVGPMVQAGQYSETINHYTVLRTLEDMYGLPHAGHSADVSPITDVWTGATNHFSVTTGAANPDVAGTPFDVTVTAKDAGGNTVTDYRGTVHFTSSDAAAGLPADYTFTAGDGGTHTFANGVTLKTAGSQTITATDKQTSSITGNATVTVTPAAAAMLSLTGLPSSVAAGTPATVTVTATDPYGNTATGYRGTVHFTSTDGASSLPGDYAFTATDNGAHTFTSGVTMKTVGNQTVTATDKQSSSITGDAAVTVTPGAAAALVVTDLPASVTAGAPATITVTAYDAYGNVATGYTGTTNFSSTDGGATLPGNYTFTAGDNGTHTFPAGVTLVTAGNQSVTVSDSMLTATAVVTVTPAATSQFQIIAPSSASSGVPFDITVMALDPYGNVDTNYTGTATFSSSDGDPGVVLPPDYTFQSTDGGVAYLPGGVTLITMGPQTVAVTDTNNNQITGSTTVTVTTGPLTGLGNFGNSAMLTGALNASDVALAPAASRALVGTRDVSSRLDSAGTERFLSGAAADGDALINLFQGVPNGTVLPNGLALSLPDTFLINPLSVDKLFAD
jgi:hypothetical protein